MFEVMTRSSGDEILSRVVIDEEEVPSLRIEK